MKGKTYFLLNITLLMFAAVVAFSAQAELRSKPIAACADLVQSAFRPSLLSEEFKSQTDQWSKMIGRRLSSYEERTLLKMAYGKRFKLFLTNARGRPAPQPLVDEIMRQVTTAYKARDARSYQSVLDSMGRLDVIESDTVSPEILAALTGKRIEFAVPVSLLPKGGNIEPAARTRAREILENSGQLARDAQKALVDSRLLSKKRVDEARARNRQEAMLNWAVPNDDIVLTGYQLEVLEWADLIGSKGPYNWPAAKAAKQAILRLAYSEREQEVLLEKVLRPRLIEATNSLVDSPEGPDYDYGRGGDSDPWRQHDWDQPRNPYGPDEMDRGEDTRED